jgi:hypothetical protein
MRRISFTDVFLTIRWISRAFLEKLPRTNWRLEVCYPRITRSEFQATSSPTWDLLKVLNSLGREVGNPFCVKPENSLYDLSRLVPLQRFRKRTIDGHLETFLSLALHPSSSMALRALNIPTKLALLCNPTSKSNPECY